MIVSSAGPVPVVGGPLDGASRPFSSHGKLCATFVSPVSIRHEWYELKTWGRWANGRAEYKDRWVYVGRGSLEGPE